MSDAASEIARLRAALAASEARAAAAESDLAQARAVVSTSGAMIKHLRLEIAKLRREQYGISSERHARLIDQCAVLEPCPPEVLRTRRHQGQCPQG